MKKQFERMTRLVGEEAMTKLENSRVIVFGVGGVGGYVVEALARAGVGAIDVVDNDIFSETNLNRQILALHSTVGRSKVKVAGERIHDINPDCKVTEYEMFYLPETADQIDLSKVDYIVDAIDTVSAKLELVMRAKELGIPILCSMGTGNKLDPTKLAVTDIYKTSICPLAKVMRHECKKRGIKKLKVLYSTELPIKTANVVEGGRRGVPGSSAFVPSAAGLIIASEVVRDLIK